MQEPAAETDRYRAVSIFWWNSRPPSSSPHPPHAPRSLCHLHLHLDLGYYYFSHFLPFLCMYMGVKCRECQAATCCVLAIKYSRSTNTRVHQGRWQKLHIWTYLNIWTGCHIQGWIFVWRAGERPASWAHCQNGTQVMITTPRTHLIGHCKVSLVAECSWYSVFYLLKETVWF